MNRNNNVKQARAFFLKVRGFTLLEVTIYMGIVSIVVGSIVLFAWDAIYARVKSDVQNEVTHNLRYVTQKISYEIRNAEDINYVNTNSISLASADSGRDPTVFILDGEMVKVGIGNDADCPAANPCSITSNRVNVTDFAFTDLSDAEENYKVIRYTITIESVNPSNRADWNYTQTFTTSEEVRTK